MVDTLTVRDLVLDPSLDTTVLAGQPGLDREVKWAQTSEAVDPWRWLGEAELLMTLGMNLPTDPAGQVAFIRKVDAAGIAAVALGADGLAPELSGQMIAQANALGLPILLVGKQVPFVVIARTVATATANQSRSILALSRLYQVAATQSPDDRKSGGWVHELFGFTVTVSDSATGCLVIGNQVVAPRYARNHSLGTIRPTTLHIDPHAHVDALALVHLKQILTVDTNAILQQTMTDIAAGERTFLSLRTGNDVRQHPPTDHFPWGSEPYRLIATDEANHDRLVLTLALSNLPPIATRLNGRSFVVVAASAMEQAKDLVELIQVRVGCSAEHWGLGDLSGAMSEAGNALSQAARLKGTWLEFQGERVSLLTRSLSESREAIQAVLGPLASEEDTSTTVLRESLFLLLDRDLQWIQTASELGIHRQTLAYRIRRAEALTGRQLRRVADLAELWLARQAWTLVSDSGTSRV